MSVKTYMVEFAGRNRYVDVDGFDSTTPAEAIRRARSYLLNDLELSPRDVGELVAYPEDLTRMLVNSFEDWIGTESEDLLEDGGLVRDHLRTAYDMGLDVYNDEDWEAAWAEFDRCTGRG